MKMSLKKNNHYFVLLALHTSDGINRLTEAVTNL